MRRGSFFNLRLCSVLHIQERYRAVEHGAFSVFENIEFYDQKTSFFLVSIFGP